MGPSEYKGVYLRNRGKWQSQITVSQSGGNVIDSCILKIPAVCSLQIDGKKYYLGSYDGEADAARAFDRVASVLGRPRNFPEEDEPEVLGLSSKRADQAVAEAVKAAKTFVRISNKAKKQAERAKKQTAERAKTGAVIQSQKPPSLMDEAEDEAYSPTSSANAESVPVQVKLEQQQTTNNHARKRKRDETSQLSEPFEDLQEATAPFTTQDQTDTAAASQACAAVKRLRDEQIYPSGREIPIVTVNEDSLCQKWENMAKATRSAFPQGIKRPRPRGEPGLGGRMRSRATSTTQHNALLI